MAVVIHELSLPEVAVAAECSLRMKFFLYDLIHGVDITMVDVVGHGHHRRSGQAITEAARAHLSVKVVEEALIDQIWRPDLRILL